MNQDQAEGNWKQLKGKAQQKWGDLTNDDVDKMKGSRTELIGKIQEKYGKSKEEAEREVDEFFNSKQRLLPKAFLKAREEDTPQ